VAAAETPGERASQLRHIGQATGVVLAPVVSAFNLQDLVFADSEGLVTAPLMEAIGSEIRRRILPANTADFTVRAASLGSDVSLFGACALVLQEELGIT
jgi:hypothetical protein